MKTFKLFKNKDQFLFFKFLFIFIISVNSSFAQFIDPSNDNPNYDRDKLYGTSKNLNQNLMSNAQSYDWSIKKKAKSTARSVTDECNANPNWIDMPAGFSVLPKNDDGSIGVTIPFTFSFDGTDYTSLFINNNGNISFGQQVVSFSAQGFPISTPMIAPFWADVQTTCASCGIVEFIELGTNALLISWQQVGYFNNQSDKLNTFQLILSDGTYTGIPGNVRFNYCSMEWTTGSASQGIGGFGGVPAKAGVNAGVSGLFLETASFNDASVNILNGTTVDFDVANSVIISAVCQDITVVLDQNGNYNLSPLEVDGGSNASSGIASMTVTPNTFTAQDIGNPVQVTLTVIDNDDNEATCISTVTVESIVSGCTDPTAHNYDEDANTNDGSCETCSDGLQNGDETGIDCGGTLCASCNTGCGDLVIYNFSVNASGSFVGDITNIGDQTIDFTTGSAVLQMYQSVDNIYANGNDLPAGGFVMPPFGPDQLAPGESYSYVFGSANTSIINTHPYAIAIIDRDNNVVECNDNNNTAFVELIMGCTDPNAGNYNELANIDDGSCTDGGGGCTNELAHNYDPNADSDDGSCETCDDGVQNGDETEVDCGGVLCNPCTMITPIVISFVQDAVLDNGCSNSGNGPNEGITFPTLEWTAVPGATKYNVYLTNINAVIPLLNTEVFTTTVNYSCTYCYTFSQGVSLKVRAFVNGTWTNFSPEVTATYEPVNTDCQEGCTDDNAHNYNANATIDDGSCETCDDDIMNGDETEIDCGGTLCNPCPVYGCMDSNAHNYNELAEVDDGSCETCDDGIMNGDETEIDCGGALCIPCLGDLYVSAASISMTTLEQGDMAVVFASHNYDNVPASVDIDLHYYLSDDDSYDATDMLLDTDVSSFDVLTNVNSENFSFTLDNTYAIGTYYIVIVSDPDNLESETDESNNEYAVQFNLIAPISGNDFYILNESLDVTSASPGDDVEVVLDHYYTGTSTVDLDVEVKYYFSADELLDAGDLEVGSDMSDLSIYDDFDIESKSFTIPSGTAAGDYHVIILSDEADVFSETDETNNIEVLDLIIEEAVPDDNFYIANATVDILSPTPGTKIRMDCDQSYTGTSTSTLKVYMGYYWSTDTAFDPNIDIYIDDDKSTLKASDLYDHEYDKYTIPSNTAPGTYYVLFVADHEDEFVELDETDNVSYVAVTVVNPATIQDGSNSDIPAISSETLHEEKIINASLSNIVVYPNPTSRYINLSGTMDGLSSVSIVDGNGKIVLSKRITKKTPLHRLDVSMLPNGSYMIRLSNDKNINLVKQFIKIQ
ncbi:MAG: nidogen-like domain-containing protein [Saprospiraceae bacterium]